MKLTTVFAASCLASAFFLFAGCKSSGHTQADATATGMDTLHVNIQVLREKVGASAASLAKVVEQGEVDPVAPFEQFKKDVSAVKSAVSKTESTLSSMRSNGQAYFADWQQQTATITDPDLKESADERRERLSKTFNEIGAAMDAARTELAAYTATLVDVQTYLASDLTPAGVKSVKDKSKRVQKDASSLDEKLEDVSEVLAESAPEFKTAKPPAPAK